MKKTIFSVLASVLLPFVGSSQAYDLSEPDRINCGTAVLHNQLLIDDPSVQLSIDENERFAKEYAKGHVSNKGVISYTIPLVYHVIHNNGPENVSKADIEASVANLNEDYQKLNSDLSDVIPAFAGIAADIEVQFKLATIDPNGNCTEGITRTVSELTYAMDESVKSLVRWDPDMYLNIWVGQTVASGAGGYSFYPAWGDYNRRGIVIRSAQLGNSITHEVGHFLNLPHLWGNSNTPNDPGNCFDDDGVNDTPLCLGATSCNTSLQTCGSLDNVQNYMEYSGCSRMFTEGQKIRMHAALNSTIGARRDLWQPENLAETGTADTSTIIDCTPIADFSYNKEYICEGGSVTFTDNSYNATPTAWNWSFTGGIPDVSISSSPTIIYNDEGVYSVTHQPSTSAGSGSETKTNIITVSSLVADYSGPVIQSFENPTEINSEWIIENEEGLGWEETTAASTTGSKSMKISNFFNSNDDEKDVLISPSYDISSITSKIMTFKQAFAKKTSADNDKLIVYYSVDCGQNWAFAGTPLTSSILPTVNSTQSTNFTPGPNDWETRTVSLSNVSNATNVRFKFEFTSGGGNNIYIDDINISGTVGVEDISNIGSFSVYPNPTSSSAQISFNLIKDVNRLNVKVRNAVGQEITNIINDQSFSKGKYTLQIDEQRKLAAGIYFVEFNADDNVKVQKLIVQ